MPWIFFSNREESTFLNTLSTAVAAHNHHTHTHHENNLSGNNRVLVVKRKIAPTVPFITFKQNAMMEEPLKLCHQSKLHHTPALPFSKYKLFAFFLLSSMTKASHHHVKGISF
jgi:hypothetical protein